MSEKVNILGVKVDMVNISRSADKICEFLNDEKLSKVYTPNSEIIMAAYKDEKFLKIPDNLNNLHCPVFPLNLPL